MNTAQKSTCINGIRLSVHFFQTRSKRPFCRRNLGDGRDDVYGVTGTNFDLRDNPDNEMQVEDMIVLVAELMGLSTKIKSQTEDE